MALPVTDAAHRLRAARRRVAATVGRRPLIFGLAVFDDAGVVVEVASPFGSETAARKWADVFGLASYQVLPARIAGGRH
ncbi:hypothetical protein Ga0074812_1393 [Parafrankia irregularis]|uniref:Uncharacterized protein n=2 Tax=Parafrankia TaxID=2994362 RepID=A0A0S4QZG3_9ACTN|nr:hypothetical protein [Parafrankia irregularis]CUU60370.1 hypothetical protein Ga0074812_1393 [Parafrankia irregularis]